MASGESSAIDSITVANEEAWFSSLDPAIAQT